MVTVLGHRGMLGSVVQRRWLELGDTDHIVNCIRPDDLAVSRAFRGIIQPSTDAIAEDTEYAATKRELEAIEGAVTIRSGIVDITRQPTIAYTDWWCNPLTPLEWADLAWEMRDTPGLHVAGRQYPASRWMVVDSVAMVFGKPRPETAKGGYLSRIQVHDRDRPSLWDALVAYRDWLGPRAGGPVRPGTDYVVGERGPERLDGE